VEGSNAPAADRERKIAGEYQSIGSGSAEELANPFLLRLVTGNNGTKEPATLCQQ